jgi:hypothetical protein
MASIQAPAMQVAIATVHANDKLRLDFDASVNFLRAFIASSSTKTDHYTRNVSQVNTAKPHAGCGNRGRGGRGGRGGGRGGRGSDKEGKGLDRWNMYKEWKELDDKKKKIQDICDKRKVSSTTTDEDQEPEVESRKDPSGGSCTQPPIEKQK